MAADTMRLRARVTFNSEQYGKIRAGEVFWSDPGYAKAMVQRNNAVYEPEANPEPDRKAVITAAPLPGKEPTTESAPDPSPDRTSDAPLDDGAEKPVFASPPVRRSRKKMLPT